MIVVYWQENLLYCAAKAGRQNVMRLIMSIMKLRIDDKLTVNDNHQCMVVICNDSLLVCPCLLAYLG
jgi:hypothetical protein